MYLFTHQGTLAFLCLWSSPIFYCVAYLFSVLMSFSYLFIKEISPLSGLWVADILPNLSFVFLICLLYFLLCATVFFCCWIYHFLCYSLIFWDNASKQFWVLYRKTFSHKALPQISSSITFHFLHLELCYCSVVKLCLTLWDPMDCSTPGFSVLCYLQQFAQTHVRWVRDAIQPTHPLSSPSLALNLSQH